MVLRKLGGFGLALGTAAALDLLLPITFGWSELISRTARTRIVGGLGFVWVVASGLVGYSRRRRRPRSPSYPQRRRFYRGSSDHYLKGDYYQAERVLEGLLRRNLRDVDARLMLATLLRHAGRLDEAAGQLDTLARLEGAEMAVGDRAGKGIGWRQA